jgi:hypothetical protein
VSFLAARRSVIGPGAGGGFGFAVTVGCVGGGVGATTVAVGVGSAASARPMGAFALPPTTISATSATTAPIPSQNTTHSQRSSGTQSP